MPKIKHHGEGFHYVVHYKPDITSVDYTQVAVHDWTQGRLEVPNQPVFQPYLFAVEAKNNMNLNLTPVNLRYYRGFSGEGSKLLDNMYHMKD